MKFSRKALIFIILSIIFAAILLFFVFLKGKVRDPADRVASLTFFKNIVEERYAGEIQWRPSILEDNLFEEDAVKTHSGAEAAIAFVDSAVVTVEGNSIIIIRKMEKNSLTGNVPSFEIVNGHVEVVTKTRMEIITPKGELTIIPVDGKGRVKIVVEEGKGTKISLLTGKGIASVGNEALELATGQGVEIADKIPEKVIQLLEPPEILEPADGQKYPYWGTRYPEVIFKFKETPYTYHLQVSEDPNFTRLAFNLYTKESSISIKTLKKGDYYWNVGFVDKEGFHGVFSKTRKISVLVGESLKPASTPSIVVEEKPPPAEIKREIPLRVTSAVGKSELVRAGKSEDVIRNLELKSGDELGVPFNAHLELSFDRGDSLELREGSRMVLNSIVGNEEVGEKEAVTFLKEGTVLLNLQKVKGSNVSYIIKTSSSAISVTTRRMKSFTSQIAVEKLDDGSTRLLALTGKISIMVLGVEKSLEPNSSVIFPSSKGTPPVLGKAPISRISLDYGKKSRIFYEFELPLVTYRLPSKRNRFLFELSANSNFKPVVLSEFGKESYFTNFSPKEGRYYWRYKDLSGKSSVPQEFVVVRTSRLSFETLKAVIFENEPDRIIWFDQRPPIILLTWDKTKGASSYEVEIYSDSKFKSRVFSKNVSDTKLSFLADFFKEGDYFWRVRKYSADSKLITTGKEKSFSLRLNIASPTLRIDVPLNNSFFKSGNVLTKGYLFNKGTLWINGSKILEDSEGPFEFKLKLTRGRNQIIYKEIDSQGTVSYYLRNISIKQ